MSIEPNISSSFQNYVKLFYREPYNNITHQTNQDETKILFTAPTGENVGRYDNGDMKQIMNRIQTLENQTSQLQRFCLLQFTTVKSFSESISKNFETVFNNKENTRSSELNVKSNFTPTFDVKSELGSKIVKEENKYLEIRKDGLFKAPDTSQLQSQEPEMNSNLGFSIPVKDMKTSFPLDVPIEKLYKEAFENERCPLCDYIPKCDSKSNKNQNLKQHLNNVHYKIKSQYRCSFCEQHYASKQNLQIHIQKQHSNKVLNMLQGDTTHPTKLEPQDFSQSTPMRSNRGFKQNGKHMVQCPFCDHKASCKTGSAARFNLNLHIKGIHDRILDNFCSFCDFKSSHSNILREHLRTKHDESSNNVTQQLPVNTQSENISIDQDQLVDQNEIISSDQDQLVDQNEIISNDPDQLVDQSEINFNDPDQTVPEVIVKVEPDIEEEMDEDDLMSLPLMDSSNSGYVENVEESIF